ncbi:MAG: CHAT domain-containing protein, partial [Saprospiraceae bacterium]|nr:CHAT domain-containing protein [Saprospiraceae bacterium]
QDFYNNLNHSLTKDRALRKAKLQFLSQSPEELSNPLYWAGMILVGDISPVEIQSSASNSILFFLGLGIVSVLLFIFYRYYFNSKIQS